MPQDNYNPVQTQAPQIASPDNLLSTRASGDAFGAQVGQATQKLGGVIEEAGKQQVDIGIQYQQRANDAAVANAETQLNASYGDTNGWYKAKQYQDAISSYPEAQQRLIDARQRIRVTLPNDAARRSFDLLAARSEGFELKDYGNHMGTQEKAYVLKSDNDLRQNLIDQTSRFAVASDDRQLGYIEGSIKTVSERLVRNQGWDLNTPEGKAILQREHDLMADQIWKNVIKTLADDPERGDVNAAVKKLEENAENMPAKTYADLSQALSPRWRSEQSRDGAHEILSGADKDYSKSVTSVSPLAPPPGSKDSSLTQPMKESQGKAFEGIPLKNAGELTDKFIQQESGGRGKNLGQIQPDTWKLFAKPGEDISSPIDNRNVTQRILTKYSQDYNGDLGRIAVAYFSGPGNVAPAGSANPWKEDRSDSTGKTTSGYVSDITSQRQQAQGQPQLPDQKDMPVYRTKAEYFELHKQEIDQKARDWAQQHFPNDIRMSDEVVARTQQLYSGVIQEENAKKASSSSLVQRFVFGEQNDNQMISNINQLENGPLEVRDAWHYMRANNPLGAEAMERAVTNHAKTGTQLTYGTNFGPLYNKVLTGEITDIAQLRNYLGPTKDSPLTNTGFAQLVKAMQLRQTPEGQPFSEAMRTSLDAIHKKIGYDAKGNELFEKFLRSKLPQIEAARNDKKGIGDLFDEEGSDYIGSDIKLYQRTPDELKKDMLKGIISPDAFGLGPKQPSGLDYKMLDSIKDKDKAKEFIQNYTKGKKISPEEKQQMTQYAIKRGWLSTPSATSSAPQVPNAQ